MIWGRELLKRTKVPALEPLDAAPVSLGSASLPDRLRIYAFGDVHGRADLLQRLRDEARKDMDMNHCEHVAVIGLGDYIDRGPDSRGVAELLLEGFGSGVNSVLLRGNHEDLLLRFLDQPEIVGRAWFRIGGLDCLKSYGVDIDRYTGADPDLHAARNELAPRLPTRHLALFQSMRTFHTEGDFLFVHAGVRADVPLDRQATDDLLWIRKGFSDRDVPFEKVVVHGHTPSEAPYIGRHRINVDTGAYATGQLTCVVLEGSEQRLLQVTIE